MNREYESTRIVVLMEDDSPVGYYPADCMLDMVRDWVAAAPKGVSRDLVGVDEFSMRELLDMPSYRKS